jgi:putative transposase
LTGKGTHVLPRWVSGESCKTKPRKPGRPRKPEEIRQLIIQMVRFTGWGYKRILGELRKLRIYSVSRATISRILKENEFEPGHKRGDGTWHDFIQRHIKTMWATDFFTKDVWTPRGLVQYYILFFINLDTRRVHVAGMTPNPNGPWMAQQARNMTMIFGEEDAEHFPTRSSATNGWADY